MRNLLMTKFGTPTGAGPGRPSVSVGLSLVGAPSGVRMSPGLVFLRFRSGFAGSFSSRNSPGADCSSFLGLSCGSFLSASPAGSFAFGGPPSSTFFTRALISGSWIASGGVPGGTSTVVTTSWPPSSVIVMTRSSARAGNEATPKPATSRARVAAPKRIFLVIPRESRLVERELPHRPQAPGPYRKKASSYRLPHGFATLNRRLHAGELREPRQWPHAPAQVSMPPTWT